jgi:5-aminolevulinate synthase
MDRLSTLTLARFNNVCPYLGRTKPRTLRSLSTATSTRYPSVSRLAVKAAQCPVMGPVISLRSTKLAAGYASVAGINSGASTADPEVHRIHQQKGVRFDNATEADIDRCPHAGAARHAAKVAADLAAAKKVAATKQAAAAAAGGCPFHAQAAKPSVATTATTAPAAQAQEQASTSSKFDYEQFYVNELDKKRKDSSYRYFNNINRLATKFPVAHTGDLKDEVEVWCANDYLGMGNNPVVLETMQYVCFSLHFF